MMLSYQAKKAIVVGAWAEAVVKGYYEDKEEGARLLYQLIMEDDKEMVERLFQVLTDVKGT